MLYATPIGNRQLAIGNVLARVLNRFPTLLEHLAIPDEARARVGGQFEVLCQLQTRRRTRFLAQSAEHAPRSVEDKFVEHFLAARLSGDDDLDVHRNHVDAIFGTRDRAEVAGDAERVMRVRIHV